MDYQVIVTQSVDLDEPLETLNEIVTQNFDDAKIRATEYPDVFVLDLYDLNDDPFDALDEFKKTQHTFKICAFRNEEYDWVEYRFDENDDYIPYEGNLPEAIEIEDELLEAIDNLSEMFAETIIQDLPFIQAAAVIFDDLTNQVIDLMEEHQKHEDFAKLAAEGTTEEVDQALEKFADPQAMIRVDYYLAGQACIQSGNRAVLKHLLRKADEKQDMVEALFVVACEKGDLEIVKLLISECDSNKLQSLIASDSYDAYYVANISQNVDLANYLINVCEPNDRKNMIAANNYVSFVVACEKGNEALVDLNLQHCGKENIQKMIFTTPPTMLLESAPCLAAASEGHQGIVEKLYKLADEDGLRGLRTIAEKSGKIDMEKLKSCREDKVEKAPSPHLARSIFNRELPEQSNQTDNFDLKFQ